MEVPAPWLAVLAVLWLGMAATLFVALRTLLREVRKVRSARQSQATRYGQITEQFAPFLAAWPWDPNRFRFLGDPVDGVQFNADGIVFVEIKSAGSHLKPSQREVRDHVAAGRVTFREIRIG